MTSGECIFDSPAERVRERAVKGQFHSRQAVLREAAICKEERRNIEHTIMQTRAKDGASEVERV